MEFRTIGTISAGAPARAVAAHAAHAGRPVLVSNSRGPSTLGEAVAAIWPGASAATFEEAVAADLITVVSPGLTRSELTGSIGDSGIKDAVREQMGIAIPAAAIGEAVLYAIGQPAEVDVSELVVRPTAQG